MLNNRASLVRLLPLFDEHMEGMLREHLANSGPQLLQPRQTDRKSGHKPRELRGLFKFRRFPPGKTAKPAEFGFVIGIHRKP